MVKYFMEDNPNDNQSMEEWANNYDFGPVKSTAETAPLSLGELLDKQFDETLWVVQDLIPANSITMLSGEPKTYKSWLAYHLAISAAGGGLFLNNFRTYPTPALIINEENPERIMQQRFKLLSRDKNIPVHTLSFREFKLNDKDKVQRLKDDLNSLGSKMVIFDSFVRIHSLDENDSKQMAELFQVLRTEFANQGYTVVLLHHNRKRGAQTYSSAQEMRGSSDIYAGLDCHLGIKRNGDILTIEQTKLREQEELPPFQIKVISSTQSVEFQYLGAAPRKGDPKSEEARGKIMAVLSGSPEKLNKEQIFRKAKSVGCKVGKSVILKTLQQMIDGKEVAESPGTRNSKLCSLADPESAPPDS